MIAFTFLLAFCSGQAPFFLETFDTPPAARATGTALIARPDTFGNAGTISRRDSSGSATANFPLDPKALRGRRIQLSSWSRAVGLSHKPNPWNGVKVMLVLTDSSGHVDYPQLAWPDANGWAWTRSGKYLHASWSLKSAILVVGLEAMAGEVRFDSLRIDTGAPIDRVPARDPSLPIPDFSPTRLRGAMIGTDTLDSAGIVLFGNTWKGNLLRWQLNGPWKSEGLIDPKYQEHLAHDLAILDRALPLCRLHGIQVVVDLHSLSKHLFHDVAAQTRLIETWKRLVNRYRNEPAVWGWDLANEPVEDEWHQGILDWNALSDTLARTIRTLDTQKVIIVEPAMMGGVEGLRNLQPVGWKRGYDIPRVVYSFHFYDPGTLTHQGVQRGSKTGIVYPGRIGGDEWDSAALRKALAPAYEFQQRYRVPLYVGEFSCIRWAPDSSAYRWLRDATRLFEEAGWDWSYHAFREWQGWSVEYPSGSHDLTHPVETDRQRLLRGLFAKNKPAVF
jgi:hypothetical protein